MTLGLRNSELTLNHLLIRFIRNILLLYLTTTSSFARPTENHTTQFEPNNPFVTIHGHVTNQTGIAIGDAILVNKWGDTEWRTSIDGEFTIRAAIGDTIVVKHPDYYPNEFVLEKAKVNYFISLEKIEYVVKTPSRRNTSTFLRNVYGTVIDDTGKGLSHTQISIKLGNQITFANSTGRFEIDSIPIDSKLEISHVGFLPQEFTLPKDHNGDTISLKKSVIQLNEVVITNSFAKKFELKKDDFYKHQEPQNTLFEHEATFPGGQDSLYQFLAEKIIYPQEALKAGITGKVLVNFTIDKNGAVTDIHLVKGLGPLVDPTVLNIISIMPDWISATQYTKDVATEYSLSFHFDLE